jgi:hypothetical protein
LLDEFELVVIVMRFRAAEHLEPFSANARRQARPSADHWMQS